MFRWTLLLGLLCLTLTAMTTTTLAEEQDLFSAVSAAGDELAPLLEGRACAVGPVWNDDTRHADLVTGEVLDELSQALATRGVLVKSLAPREQEKVIAGLADAEFVIPQLDLSGLEFLMSQDALVVGSLAKWGRGFVLKVRAYELPGLRLLGGSSQQLDRNSLPSDYVQDAFGMDNPSDLRMQEAKHADFENSAIGGGFARFPGVDVQTLLGFYENKLNNYVSFSAMISKFAVSWEEELSYPGLDDFEETKTESADAILFSASIRFYPFYRGKGLSGFFLGGGLGFGNFTDEVWHESEWNEWGAIAYELGEGDSGGVLSAMFEFGRKFVMGERLFVEPCIQLSIIAPENRDPMPQPTLGVSAGCLF